MPNHLYIIIALASLCIATVAMVFKRKGSNRKRLLKILQDIDAFFAEFELLKGRYIQKATEVSFREKWNPTFCRALTLDPPKSKEARDRLEKFKKAYSRMDELIAVENEKYISQICGIHHEFFANIDGKCLDKAQREAVVAEEDRALVIAGAGSGKTLTIAAKVKYLCEIRREDPKDILLISFTKKAAKEMSERIGNLGVPIQSMTFHKFGKDILSEAEGNPPEVADDLNGFLHHFFDKEIGKRTKLLKDLMEFFAYYIEIPKDLKTCKSIGELYDAEKDADLETLKTKYGRAAFIRQKAAANLDEFKTLKKERVKSLEEVQIANFLFMNGVNYEYERPYPFPCEDKAHKAYRPDFYLSDYDIYLEHFGVTKDFRTPQYSPAEEKIYLEGIRWKRAIHKKNGTRLIETYSYYNSEGILLSRLEEILSANKVVLKEPDFADIFNTVYAGKAEKHLSPFIELCDAFIKLFKSNGFTANELKAWMKLPEENAFLMKRKNLFLSIAKTLIDGYEAHLKDIRAIDFADMINRAEENLRTGKVSRHYKHIIVDEFQDVSKAQVNLLLAAVKQTQAKLFCVGDDWQSIFRFAGSDISLFTEMEKFFGPTKILKIERTYRNSQHLIDEASRFILKNPKQIPKCLKSDKRLDYPIVFWGDGGNPSRTLKKILDKIISEFGVEKSILLLGRTNGDFKILKDSGLFKTRSRLGVNILECYRDFPQVPVSFLTVHKSKGLEADNVVILNFKDDVLGFPCQKTDDRILRLVLSAPEDFPFAEERRLFYVAMTRTRNRTFVLTDSRRPSAFLSEFSPSVSVCFFALENEVQDRSVKCPRCKTGFLKEFPGSELLRCSHFPRCRYTFPKRELSKDPKICPECGDFLILRKSKRGQFWGCHRYPDCRFTKSLTDKKFEKLPVHRSRRTL